MFCFLWAALGFTQWKLLSEKDILSAQPKSCFEVCGIYLWTIKWVCLCVCPKIDKWFQAWPCWCSMWGNSGWEGNTSGEIWVSSRGILMFVYSYLPQDFKPLMKYAVLAPCVSTLSNTLQGNSYFCLQFHCHPSSPASGVGAQISFFYLTCVWYFQVSRLLDLIVHSLYSHKEVFLRELVRYIGETLSSLAIWKSASCGMLWLFEAYQNMKSMWQTFRFVSSV